MAYTTGPYSDPNDALDLLAAWGVTNGWTEDRNSLEGINRRVHLSKNIDGTDAYFSMKVMLNQAPFITHVPVYGIAVQGCTGYDSGSAWNAQPGYTTNNYTGTTSVGGCVDDMISSGGTYYFFATATTLTAVFETDSDFNDYRQLTIGTVGGFIYYGASGGAYKSNPESRAPRSRYRTINTANEYACSIYDGSGWYMYDPDTSSTVGARELLSGVTSQDPNTTWGSLADAAVRYSPDDFRGNPVLAPDQLMVTTISGTVFQPVGFVEGVKFINMTNYSNTQEITIGTDTYKLFEFTGLTTDVVDSGVALLK